MSVICQNFVQNAWKKDLCSNCFKSLSDHDASCGDNHRMSTGSSLSTTPGYISQATTIYQSRGLLNHATWTSLLSEKQQDKNSGVFKLENGFHGKLLTISPNGTTEKRTTINIPRVNGMTNGHYHNLYNGNSTQSITNGILKASKSPSGKTITYNGMGKGLKVSVGFQEGEAQVIGYGGNDYDSDDNEWEMGSPDDGEFPLESLDSTDEDRAISRITRENTEFNSKNDNLLKTNLVATCIQKQNKAEEKEHKAKNINGFCRNDVKESENSSGGWKGVVPNGLPAMARPQSTQRREAPPQASVKPMLRDEGQGKNKVLNGDISKEKIEPLASDLKAHVSQDPTVEVIHESVIVLVDSEIPSTPLKTNKMNKDVTDVQISDATPRASFLHGTPNSESSSQDAMTSAIYTPGKTDLFVHGSRSSSEESSPKTGSLHQRQRSISENDLVLYQSSPEVSSTTAGSQRGSKPDHAISDSNLAAGNKNVAATSNSSEKGSASSQESSPASSRLAESPARRSSGDEPAVYYAVSNTIIHTECERPTPHVATLKQRVPVCHYAESSVYLENKPAGDTGSNRSSPNNRESKLAALAQELEQARHAGSQKRQAPSPPKVAETSQPPSTVTASQQRASKPENPYGYASIYGKYNNPTVAAFPSSSATKTASGKTKSATISSVQGKKVLALLTLEDNTKPTKKGKFSIKKFLKRGKDLESIDTIFRNGTSPNPKAWKQNSDFDRSKLKLEIIHPMDMVGHKEVQSTNPAVSPDGHYASSSPPSLTESSSSYSGTAQEGSITSDPFPRSECYSTSSGSTCKSPADGIYDDDTTWQVFSPTGCSPLPTSDSLCPGEDVDCTTPVLSTFSPTGSTEVCLPAPDQPSSPVVSSAQEPIYSSHRLNTKAVRPPKPPPPPRIRPFSPVNGHREIMSVEEQPRRSESQHVGSVPKPQVPKRLFRPSSKTDYANLGEIRSPMAPEKPDRSPTSMPPGSRSSNEDLNNYEPIDVSHSGSNNTSQESVDEHGYYETYEDIYQEGSSLSSNLDFYVKSSPDLGQQPVWRDSDKVTLTVSSPGEGPPGRGGQSGHGFCSENSAWLSLEQSYAIVAAANHEILAKLTSQVVQQKLTSLIKSDGQPLYWSDFCLQTSQPLRMIGRDKTIFNAIFRQPSKREVTLVVTSPPNGLSGQESPSKALFLATFSDTIPSLACAWDAENGENTQQALVHVLPKSDISSVRSAFLDNKDKQTSPSFEKEFCFVFLQLIQALKILQAHGTEEVDVNMEDIILYKGGKAHLSCLLLFSSDFAEGSKVALCQYALKFMLTVLGMENMDNLPTSDNHPTLSQAGRKIFITIAKVLSQEKASSLSKAKNLLEFHLWGPREYIYNLLHGTQGVEDTLQRWLDIERAQSLRQLVRSHKKISVYEEQQNLFLVHTSAKILKDLSSSLCFEKL